MPAANTAGATTPSAPSAPAPSASSAAGAPVVSSNPAAIVAPAPTTATVDPENKTMPPLSSPELERSARDLFDAIVADDPSKAHDFFFPREPFTPLKDVANPDRYWLNLYRAYEHDIHQLHGKRRDWSSASFESFELGSQPTWVKPGDEYNKVGYFRTFGGKLRYRFDGKRYTLKVHTLISWNGRWTITHLLPFKK